MRLRLCVLLAGLLVTVSGVLAQESYPVHPDSKRQKGVPIGKIEGPFPWKSRIYPGTARDYWIYVPAQHDPAKPSCVMVVQDGLRRAEDWKLPIVLDNLIHQEQVPVTIGIFIEPGVVPAPHADAQPRFNRSFEYDSLGDRYARFLIEEILPEVGARYKLSDDPNDRSIAGASSGAICAFNVAWERPDQFRRVLSTIGTYVGLRGGNNFPVLVRKTESKPIRVYLQDGRNDLNLYGGSWWVANQDMLSSLEWAGYDVEHAWGDGGHNGRHGAAIMPDALRWLWRDYPEPVRPGAAAERRTDILLPGERWQKVSSGHSFTEGPAVNLAGEVFFTDIPNSKIFKIGLDDQVSLFAENTGKANGLMFGADGRLFACADGQQQIISFDSEGNAEVLVKGVRSNDLVVGKSGIYFTNPADKQVGMFDGSNVRVVDTGIERPNGIILSPDQTQLYVADTSGQFAYVFQVREDGSLAHKQQYFHLHLEDGQTSSGADGMTVDTEGRVYVATRLGVQVCDQLGRVHMIIPKPHNQWLSNVVFGGPNLDTLYVTCGDSVFKRRLNAKGVVPSRKRMKPPKPRL